MSARQPRTAAGSLRRPAVVAGLIAVALAASTLAAGPAEAFNIYCGVDAIGVRVNYVTGRDNGHPEDEHDPDDDGGIDGWGGKDAERTAGAVVLSLDRVIGAMEIGIDIFDTHGFDTYFNGVGQKSAKLGATIAKTVLDVAKEAADITLMRIQQQNALVDGCDALIGDMVDSMLLAMIEEELAYIDLDGQATNEYGQVPGTRRVPTSMFLLPQDGMPAWQRDAHLYTDYGDHDALEIYHMDGVLNSPYIGLAVTVRNQIAYMFAAGMAVGDAGTEWVEAMALLRSGDLTGAYQGLVRAYRTAVTATPDPGPAPTASPTPDPWANSGSTTTP